MLCSNCKDEDHDRELVSWLERSSLDLVPVHSLTEAEAKHEEEPIVSLPFSLRYVRLDQEKMATGK